MKVSWVRTALDLSTVIALLVSAVLWGMSASPPQAALDRIADEMKVAAKYSGEAAVFAGLAALFQAVSIICHYMSLMG